MAGVTLCCVIAGEVTGGPAPRQGAFVKFPFLTVYTEGVISCLSLSLKQCGGNKYLKAPMTKRDIVIRISNETQLVQQQVLEVVQKTLDYISEAVSHGRKVELRNFGVFEVKVRKARVGRNPNRPGTDVPIPQRAVVKFKPGKEMREAVLKLTPKDIQQDDEPGDDESDISDSPTAKK